MSWVEIETDDKRLTVEDEKGKGGSRVRLTWPNGDRLSGRLTVLPSKWNAQVVMARLKTAPSGDTWMDVAEADIELWVPRRPAFEEGEHNA